MEDSSHIRMILGTVPVIDQSPIILDILLILLLILINAFFAASEIAIISLNDNKVKRKAEEGDKNAVRLYKLISEPSSFLATIQVGVTLAGFLSSAFAADRFAERLFALIGVQSSALQTVSVILVTLIMSYFSLVFGELVPKRVAQHNPEKFSSAVVGTVTTVGKIMRPFVLFLTISTNLILRILGIDPNVSDRTVTEEEIRLMVDVGRESGSIHAQEKEMIENIFEFNDTEVSEIMTHRTNIVSLDVDSSYDEVLSVAVNEKYTRIPVYEDNIDNIIGILHIKDLLYHAAEGLKQPFSLRNMIRPPYIVPETKNIDATFREMQRDRAQLAVVIDEYGGTAGIITIEDLLEEIVGNIQDEYDEEETLIIQAENGSYDVSGMATPEDVGEVLGVRLPDEDYDTIAGLVITLMGRIPDEDEQPEVMYENLVFRVMEMDEKRISRLRITKIEPEIESEPGSDE